MVIKSKNSKAGRPYSPFYYAASILLVVLFVGVLSLGVGTVVSIADEDRSLNEIFQMKDFRYSRSFMEKYDDAAQKVYQLLNEYHDEEYIRSGEAINSEELELFAQERYNRLLAEREAGTEGAGQPSADLNNGESLQGVIQPDQMTSGQQGADFGGGGDSGSLTEPELSTREPDAADNGGGDFSEMDGQPLSGAASEDLPAGLLGQEGQEGQERLPDSGLSDGLTSGETGTADGQTVDGGPDPSGSGGTSPKIDEALMSRIREETRQEMIETQLKDYLQILSDLEANGINYYAADGTVTVTNLEGYGEGQKDNPELKDEFTSAGAWGMIENNKLTMEPSYEESPYYVKRGYLRGYLEELRYQNSYNPDFCLYLSFSDEALSAEQRTFIADKNRFKGILPTLGAGLLAIIILLAYQVAACGRRDEKGQIIYNWFDRWFTELHLFILIAALTGGAAGFFSLMEAAFYNSSAEYGFFIERLQLAVGLDALLAIAIAMSCAFIGELAFLSIVKNVKGGRFWSNSLVGRIWLGLKSIFLSLFNGGSMERQAIIVTFLVVTFSSACFFLYPLTIIVALAGAVIWAKRYEKIKEGTRRVKEGELSYTIDVKKGELGKLAANINDISQGLDAAVQNRMKNERMRSELISNVSHDLKTPLTSIVSYIDLLKKEGLESPNAGHYLDVIDRKAQRLQKLTLDLFEAAKVSSGAIQVEMGKVELRSLVDQGLGEMEDKIANSGLEFIINATDEKFYVEADGRLLWRVVENLLTNVLKYAQENSRVYIDLKKTKHQAILIVKNVSRNRLNISADELMERFKRGDESRSTEGSGLGLAIARDLVRLQKGAFDISIDGDLFKATVILRLYPEALRAKVKAGDAAVNGETDEIGPAEDLSAAGAGAGFGAGAGAPGLIGGAGGPAETIIGGAAFTAEPADPDAKGELKAEKAKFGFAAGKAKEVKARFRKNKAKPVIMAEAVEGPPAAAEPAEAAGFTMTTAAAGEAAEKIPASAPETAGAAIENTAEADKASEPIRKAEGIMPPEAQPENKPVSPAM